MTQILGKKYQLIFFLRNELTLSIFLNGPLVELGVNY